MTGGPSKYWGQGFSPRGDKSRFVLPADFRATVLAASDKSPTLCLDKHHKYRCLVGFDLSRAEGFAAQIRHEEGIALGLRQPFDADERAAQLYGFMRIKFDESGRFVMPEHLSEQADIGDALYFHGGGDSFTIWAPDSLFKMGPGWDSAKASCRAQMADAAGRSRRK